MTTRKKRGEGSKAWTLLSSSLSTCGSQGIQCPGQAATFDVSPYVSARGDTNKWRRAGAAAAIATHPALAGPASACSPAGLRCGARPCRHLHKAGQPAVVLHSTPRKPARRQSSWWARFLAMRWCVRTCCRRDRDEMPLLFITG